MATAEHRLFAPTRIGVAVLGSASCGVLVYATFNWAMTGSWVIADEPAIWASLIGFYVIGCLLGVLATAGLWRFLRRHLKNSKIAIAVLGALVFAASTVALNGRIAIALLMLPSGIVAALIWQRHAAGPLGPRGRTGLGAAAVAATALLLMSGVEAWRATEWAEPKARPPSLLGPRLISGVGHEGELWLFDDAGKLVSLRLADWHPTLRAPRGVIALQTHGGALLALLAPPLNRKAERQPPGRFVLARHTGGRWSYLPAVAYGIDERPVALALKASDPIVISPQRIYIVDAAARRWSSRRLAEVIEPWGQISAAIIGQRSLYVGTNRGEFGGQLLRIDLPEPVAGSSDDLAVRDLCGPQRTGVCGVVTAVVNDEARAGCALVSNGVSHMGLSSGRVVRVCGDRVETLFERHILPIGERIERALSARKRKFPPSTEPVFGLASTPDGFWAVTPRGVYQAGADGIERHNVPSLKSVHGIPLSKAIPGVVVTSTDANWAYSLSGYTPMLVAMPARN